MIVEREKQLEYVKSVITTTQSKVWNKFPSDLQPDIGVILPRVSIGLLKEQDLKVHPDIPSPLRQQILRTKQQAEINSASSQIAKHDPRTRAIAIKSLAFTLPERHLKRIICHEVGEDVFSQEDNIPYTALSESDASKVRELTEYIFRGAMQPEQMSVSRFGFRKILFERGYVITDLYPDQLIIDINEIFPTAFEMITEQLLLRAGDIRVFEKHIKEGKIKLSEHEDHPAFFKTLFNVLKRMGWREFLMAFKSGDLLELRQTFEAFFDRKGTKKLDDLIRSMSGDENLLRTVNNIFG